MRLQPTLYIVTGAPGAGKSTTLLAFIALKSQFLAFDIDWLTVTASDLAGSDIIFDPSTWRAYNALWFEVLHAVCKNNQTPVFFAPTDPRDIAQYGQPVWCSQINWLLLDCADDLRRGRLRQRPEWTDTMIEEAITDATFLRQMIGLRIDTGGLSPEAVASKVRDWLEQGYAAGNGTTSGA